MIQLICNNSLCLTEIKCCLLLQTLPVVLWVVLTVDVFSLYRNNVSSFRTAHILFHDRSLVLCCMKEYIIKKQILISLKTTITLVWNLQITQNVLVTVKQLHIIKTWTGNTDHHPPTFPSAAATLQDKTPSVAQSPVPVAGSSNWRRRSMNTESTAFDVCNIQLTSLWQ